MAEKKFDSGQRKLDSLLLQRLFREISTVRDRNGKVGIYYFPLKPEYIDLCEYTFKKYGVSMKQYKSGLSPHPILKITYEEMESLPKEAYEFLMSVRVDAQAMQNRMQELLAEMNQSKK